jgi:hypothetical protein
MALRKSIATIALTLMLTIGTNGLSVDPAIAQSTDATGSPLPLGPLVVQDALTSPGLVAAFHCSSGRGLREFSDEGLVTRLRGRCGTAETGSVGLSTAFVGLTVPDGEIRVESRTLAGADRVSIRVSFRVQVSDNSVSGYRVHIDPSLDAVSIVKQTPESVVTIARRTGIGSQFGSGQWGAISVRFAGPLIWLFLDDALVLSVADDSFATGEAGISAVRLGNQDDDAEIAIVTRNVRVSGLANGDAARLPKTADYASMPPPPSVEEVILADSLIEPSMISAAPCPSGLSAIEHAGEGVVFKTRGRCRPEATTATIVQLVRGLSMLDGEIAISYKIVGGGPRASLSLNTRLRDRTWLSVFLSPETGYSDLSRGDEGEFKTLMQRNDAHRLARHDDWNRLALRTRGNEVWVLLNDQPMLYSNDANLGVGGVSLSVLRSGSVDDQTEVAVVFADLKVSALEDGDPARWPSFRQP